MSNQYKDQRETRQNLLAEKIFSRVVLLQRLLASKLQKVSEHFSNRFKWMCLVAFIIVSGGICLRIMLSNLLSNEGVIIKVHSIQKPAYTVAEAHKILRRSRNLNQNLNAFGLFNDSLNQTGSPANFDSLLTLKPGIWDTLNIYETIFQKHQKELLWKRTHIRPGQ